MNLFELDPVRVIACANTAGMALIALVCLPLYYGKIKPHTLHGVRFQESLKSEETWLKLNRYGAVRLLLWCGLIAATNLLVLLLHPRPTPMLVQLLGLSPLLILLPCWQTWRYGRRL